ncbi:MAG: quinolinate synthase NadA [candidate division WOR-3 bacterium]|nr:quinolinate synthase NadA [candidate division WOR-3 bacterium]
MAESGEQERLIAEIRQLKQKQRAVILAHNYQLPEIYEVADFIGDSLELAQAAARVESALIVFCGVRFMAENAKLVNPGRPVVLADPKAGCQMANMITAEALRRRRQELGDVLVVAYVNTPAEVKAEADICCTSANAVRVVQSLPRSPKILFVPDRNLARWVEQETGREIIPWEGFCYVHAQFTVEDVRRARIEHPGALVVVHPECPLEVIQVADRVASTSGMVRIAREVKELVLGTEAGMCNRIRREYPDCHCYPLRRTAICRNMKLTSLDDVKAALQGVVPEVEIPAIVAERAQRALKRMLEIS